MNEIPYDNIADVYDAYVQTQLDVPFFLDAARNVRGEILELMCGTGRVSLPLIEAGARLTCVDYSDEMIERLREKLERRDLRAELHVADVRVLNLQKKFELIFIPFHAFAELVAQDDQRETLRRVYEHLADDGQFICTLHNPRARRHSIDGQLHLIGTYSLPEHGELLFWMMQNYAESERVVSAHEFFEEYDAHGVMQKRRHLELRFALIEYDEFRVMAEAAGFQIRAVYGNYDKSPFDAETSPFMLWTLEKQK